MVLKFLNVTAEKFYPKTELLDEAEKLLKALNLNITVERDYKNYLLLFRQLEKGF